jgi:putative oxidoreductase
MGNRQQGAVLRDIGLLALRTGFGAVMMAHGAQKAFGWFGGGGIEGTGAYFEMIGFKPGKLNAQLAAATELGGGALMIAGLATPVAGAAAAGTMIVAGETHKENGFFAQQGGYEYALVLALVGSALALTGSGRVSLDHTSRHLFDKPWMRALAAAAIIPASAMMISKRRQVAAAAEETDPAAEI